MRKALIACLPALTVLFTATAQNLIRNPDFDRPLDREVRVDAAPQVCRVSVYTEDRTWNKCLRLDVLKYLQQKHGLSYYAQIRIGGDDSHNGFQVKPNTVYEFSLEYKGTASARVCATQWNGPNYWKDSQKIKTKQKLAAKPADQWQVLRGTFQTGPRATHATIGVSLWGEQRYDCLPKLGSFVLLDKIRVVEKQDLLGAFRKPGAELPAVPPVKTIVPGKPATGFVHYKENTPAKADTVVTATPTENGIDLVITCQEPNMDKLRATVTKDAANPWLDDAVEIFFAPVTKDRALSQFVVAAGGGRWMGRGGNTTVNELGAWQATVTQADDSWTVRASIPYSLLGWSKHPAPGTVIGFNVARDRKNVRELSSLSFAAGSFHEPARFGVLFLDSPDRVFANQKASLLKRLRDPQILKQARDWKQEPDPARILPQVRSFLKADVMARLAQKAFTVTEIPPTLEPTIPLLPDNIANPPDIIALRAAGNDYCPLPLAITNVTMNVEEYRIVLGTIGPKNEELPGLTAQDGTLFPADKIRLYRAIRVKDGDEAKHGLRFDPLAPMDLTSTLVVLPGEATPIWAIFDTADVKPGIYRGAIRVIPLSEPAHYRKGSPSEGYRGKMQTLPLTVEVLPFNLDRAPAIQQYMFTTAYNRDIFQFMVEQGMHTCHVNTWGVKVTFNPDGSVKKQDTQQVIQDINNLLKWADELNCRDTIAISIAYSAYAIFRDVHAAGQFTWNTPPWTRAWTNYVRILDHIRQQCGIPQKQFFFEIMDEPHPRDMKELIAAAKVAHQATPNANMMVTWGAWDIPLEDMRKLVPTISHWCFWGSKYFTGNKYHDFMTQLRQAGKNLSHYDCSTSRRQNLQTYYRTHAWRALAFDLDMSNLYQMLNYKYRWSDWKQSTSGETVLLAGGKPVTTIRQECLRLGNQDIKYLKKLQDLLSQSPQADPKLKAQAQAFLRDTPRQVGILMPHDATKTTQARQQAIDLILKLLP